MSLGRRPQINNDFYDTLGERWYQDDRHPIALLRAEAIQKLAYVERVLLETGLRPPSRILDIGCGAGLLTIPLAEKGYEIKGIDLSEGSLAVARSRMGRGLRLSFERGDAYSLEEGPGAYDAVLMMDFLEHLERPQAALNEAAHVLRAGGLLIFHTFNRTIYSYLLAIKAIERFSAESPRNIHVYHLFIKPHELQRMCEQAGLGIGERIGIRPRFFTKAFWWSLAHRRIHPDFEFTTTSSLLVGYLGYAVKKLVKPREPSPPRESGSSQRPDPLDKPYR